MLLPGLDESYIRFQIAALGLDCPNELVELYGICGGVGAPEEELLNHMWMYGSHYLLPFERAVEDYKLFRGDARWSAEWFPFLGNDGGDFYSICSLENRASWRKISYFMIGSGDEAQITFSSLENMLCVINECFDRGICFVDEYGNLVTRFLDASIIAMDHNKNLPYYR
jgi:hypothetical protein